jgi:hypothetical protein
LSDRGALRRRVWIFCSPGCQGRAVVKNAILMTSSNERYLDFDRPKLAAAMGVSS